jgi:RNA polymerase sigma-70 factor (ECF subfamily)
MPMSVPTLRAMFDEGRKAWPGVELDAAVFERYVLERAGPAGDPSELRAPDLYLACACVEGNDRALAEFDKRWLTEVPSFLVRTNPSPRLVEDVRQRLRERLFLERKIEQYTGRGSFGSWLRVVTLRVASNLRRQDKVHAELDSAVPAPALDPELGAIQRRYGSAFRDALRDAFAGLEADERSLLRLFYLDGLNLDRLAIVFHISRATAGRRMAAARERLVAETHRLLRERLQATSEELASLLRVVRSNLEVSLSAVLREAQSA